MNAVTATRPAEAQAKPLPPAEVFRHQLNNLGGELQSVLPRHISVDRFKRVVMTAVQQTPSLLDCTPKSLFAACLNCAKDGLLPDGREAAIVPFKQTAQYMPMANGLIKLARQSGEISTLTAQIVYEKDRFEIDLASDTRPIHEPFLDGARGKFRIAYALAVFKDGTHQLEVMTKDQIEKIRNISRAKNSGPWTDHWDEMARKTVLRRLMKYLSLSPEVTRAIEADNATYDLDMAATQSQAALPRSLAEDYAPPALEHETTEEVLDDAIPEAEAEHATVDAYDEDDGLFQPMNNSGD